MIKYVYSVFDNKARFYSAPFFSVQKEVALRDFNHMVNSPDSIANTNPGDFELHYLGMFDDETGLFDIQAPDFMISGSDVIR